MSKKSLAFFGVTIVFVLLAFGLEFLSRSVDMTVQEVDPEALQTFSPKIDTDFFGLLEPRADNAVGQDLEY